jgi:hypothetical protein
MPGIGFGKRPQPRKFDFIPRFYDAQKEELEQRLAQYDESNRDEEKAKNRIKSGLRNRYYGDAGYRDSEVKKSNLRLLYIIVILIFVSYLILRSDRLIRIIEAIG